MFHTLADIEDDVKRDRAQRREDWAVHFLITHAPDKAQKYIKDESDPFKKEGVEGEDIDEMMFLATDPIFGDKKQLEDDDEDDGSDGMPLDAWFNQQG